MLQLIRDNKIDEAIAEANRHLLNNSADHDARYALGIAHLVSGSFQESIQCLHRVLDNRPTDYKCAANLGVAYLRAKDYESAIEFLLRAKNINPQHTQAIYNLACAYLESNNTEKAVDIFGDLVKKHPDEPNYLCSLGDAYRESGKWKLAILAYNNALTVFDGFVRAHLNLGAILLHMGQLDESLKHCKHAIELEPNEPKAHKNLGDCYIQLELLDEAMIAYADAFDLDNHSPELCIAIGRVWLEIGELAEAAIWFDRAIILDEDNIAAKCCLAKIIADNASVDVALSAIEPLIAQAPDNIELLLTLSDLYWEAGDAKEAMAQLERLRELQPNRLNILTKMAGILNSSGSTDDAICLYQESLAINPTFIPALNGLATSQKGKLNDSQLLTMERMLANNPDMKPGMAASLHSGLAYYYDGVKRSEQAAFHMAEANRHQWAYRSKRDWSYCPDQQTTYISNLMKVFTSEYFERYGQIGHQSTVPVFIVAMPRSGTTLTEQILARHSKVLGVGERSFASQSFNTFTQGDFQDHPEAYLSMLTSENITAVAEQYLMHLQSLIDKAEAQGITHVVDKMPDNYALVGWILTLFPNAKIIHAARDPRDVALSCWITQFASIPWASDTTHIVKRIEQYQRLMNHWNKVLGERVYESQYESLVVNQEIESKKMIEFLGLDWEEQCLNFYESDRLVRTASITQVRQPIYNNSMAKWKRYQQYIPELIEPLC